MSDTPTFASEARTAPHPSAEPRRWPLLDRLEADGVLRVRRPDPACYGCLGTGSLRWAGVKPSPCSCLDGSEDDL